MAEGDIHPVISILAGRFPALVQQLCSWRSGQEAPIRADIVHARPLSFTQGRCVYVFNQQDGRAVRRRLLELDEDQRMVQVFPDFPHLLAFIGAPEAAGCVPDPRWCPWVLQDQAPHIDQCCFNTTPSDWPWPLWKGDRLPEGPAHEPAQRLGRRLGDLLNHMADGLVQRLQAAYAHRESPAEVLRRGKRPLRLLIPACRTTAYQKYCARDVAEGLRACGVDAHALILENTPAINFEVLQAVEHLDADVLLLNGWPRRLLKGFPENLCVVLWDQDYVLSPSPAWAEGMGPHDRLLVMLREWVQDAASAPGQSRRVFHLNIGSNGRLYHPPERPMPCEHEVLFVGNIHRWEDYKPLINFGQWPAPLQAVLEDARVRLIEWVASAGEDQRFVMPDPRAFLDASFDACRLSWPENPTDVRALVRYFQYRVAHYVLREAYVSALAGFRLGLFGKGWEHVPAVAHLCRGPVVNGPELLEAIHRSAVNLHLHTWTVHHPRLYDTAAAGGFLLVGRVDEALPLEQVFEPGRELDTFASIPELKRKVRYWLDHPEQRAAVAAAAAARAARDHDMASRMAELVSILRSPGTDAAARPIPADGAEHGRLAVAAAG